MADQPLAAKPAASLAHRQHLGMGGGVAIGHRAVPGGGDDRSPSVDHHGTDRHLPRGRGLGGEIESVAHGGRQDHGPL